VIQRACDEFDVTEVSYGRRASLKTHRHFRAAILLLVEGSAVETHDEGEAVLERDAILCRAAGLSHALRFGNAGGTLLRVDLGTERARGLPESLDLRGGDTGAIVTRLRRELRSGDRASEVAMKAAVLALLAVIVRHRPARVPATSNAALEIIRDRFRERISLREVARGAGVDSATLAKQFRRAYGRTVGDSIRDFRVEEAASLLRGTPLGLREIAVACGFYDLSHFTRSFESAHGIKPSAFRRLHGRIR
jgi:AraC family transcriptional regulator